MSPPTEPGVYLARLLSNKSGQFTHFIHIFGRTPYLQVKAYNIALCLWVKSTIYLPAFDFSPRIDLKTGHFAVSDAKTEEHPDESCEVQQDFPQTAEEPLE